MKADRWSCSLSPLTTARRLLHVGSLSSISEFGQLRLAWSLDVDWRVLHSRVKAAPADGHRNGLKQRIEFIVFNQETF
jgi:hypothetical protein